MTSARFIPAVSSSSPYGQYVSTVKAQVEALNDVDAAENYLGGKMADLDADAFDIATDEYLTDDQIGEKLFRIQTKRDLLHAVAQECGIGILYPGGGPVA